MAMKRRLKDIVTYENKSESTGNYATMASSIVEVLAIICRSYIF